MSKIPDALQQLPLPPIPAVFERAIGYLHSARYLLFYWEPAGDEPMWSDGQVTTCGEHHAYLLFVQHPRIEPSLHGYDFGGSDAPAQHGLVLDRETRAMYAGPIVDAENFVQLQQGRALTTEQSVTDEEARARQILTGENWQALIHHLYTARRVEPADIAERLRIADANCTLLRQALDALPVPEIPDSVRDTQRQYTLYRFTCGLCDQPIGTLPQKKATIVGLIRRHLEVIHRVAQRVIESVERTAWQAEKNGQACWVYGNQVLVVLEPPRLWIQDEAAGYGPLDTAIVHAMVEICRTQYAQLFDGMALLLWCGVERLAIVQWAQQLVGAESEVLQMINCVLTYLVQVRQREQYVKRKEVEP
jgi:hypothetical protein